MGTPGEYFAFFQTDAKLAHQQFKFTRKKWQGMKMTGS